jgi:hypothetical protein
VGSDGAGHPARGLEVAGATRNGSQLLSDGVLGTGTEKAGNLPIASVPIRIEHPVNGVFDVVLQSSTTDGFPETRGALSGRPIYTVYIKVGTPKEWVLQYCLPGQQTRVSGGVVTLQSPSPLKPPFPRFTIIPGQDVWSRGRRSVFHTFVTSTGDFKELKAVQGEDAPLLALLLPCLKQWLFRPATRDGAPVEVEALLIIPAAAN